MTTETNFNLRDFIASEGIRALIFDMDGTLVDNMDYHRQAWLDWAHAEGVAGSDDEILAQLHGTLREIVARLIPDETDATKLLEIGNRKEALYRKIYAPHLSLLPGLAELLNEAESHGIPLAVATAGDRRNIDFTLDGLGLRDRFAAIIGAEEVRNGKPDPEVFLLAAENLGVAPEHCLVFEDSAVGALAARRAGMRCVVVNQNEEAEHFGEVDHIAHFARDYCSLL